ncbi:MAG: hypothetical protein HOO96_29560 [Polyangiaceae bacterium]|nr:hypothetical protein [Polyangiaceae bacterium]
MGAYLEARGRQVDVLFGFLRDARLALASSTLLLEGTTLEPDSRGVVRCRLAGRPSALVRVSKSLVLDVTGFARVWPGLHAELVARAGKDIAAALVATAPLLRPLDDLEPLVLEHSVRAEHLYLLGEQPAPVHDLEGDGTFRFAFEEGELELRYTADGYRNAQQMDRDPRAAMDLDVRWKGARVELPEPGDFPWDDDEVAELALLGTMRIKTHPEDVVALYAAVCDQSFDALEPTLAVATVLNLRGVAQRKIGALDASVKTLRAAHAMACRLDPKLEQMVAYNLGYALLQTTMKSRVQLSNDGEHESAVAHYRFDEIHRSRWNECLALFERAALLDPTDVTARSQVRQVQDLLAVLDGNGGPPATKGEGATSPPSKTTTGSSSLRKDLWVPLGIAVFVVGLVFVLHALSKDSPPVEVRPARSGTPAPSANVPSARERSEAARLAALARLGHEPLPVAGASSCPLAIEPPGSPPRGEVLAPHFGRAPGTGELYGTDYFDATIRHYADRFAPELDVRPASDAGVGPVTGAEGPSNGRLNFRPFATTLVVTEWRDPVVLAGGNSITPGHVAARLVAWSYADSRFVCASAVEATNVAGLVVVQSADLARPADDPLGRARLDLIEQAYRAAIPKLRALEVGDSGVRGADAGGAR